MLSKIVYKDPELGSIKIMFVEVVEETPAVLRYRTKSGKLYSMPMINISHIEEVGQDEETKV